MKFFRISSDSGKRKGHAYGIIMGEYSVEMVHCSICGNTWRKDLLFSKDSEITITLSNHHYADFLLVVHQLLVSERALKVLNACGITGFDVKPAHLLGSNQFSPDIKKELSDAGYRINSIPETLPPMYRWFINGQVELEPHSGIVLLEHCDSCGYRKFASRDMEYVDLSQPIILDYDSWSGHDLCKAEGLGQTLLCSERFVEVYKDNRLTGLSFKDLV